ncbi:MAG: hypothetical protein AAF563_03460 [Pseudomonadota bacterium]
MSNKLTTFVTAGALALSIVASTQAAHAASGSALDAALGSILTDPVQVVLSHDTGSGSDCILEILEDAAPDLVTIPDQK